jgi:uncharacterized membrane protein YkvA (DUF1232 family)
MFPVNLTPMNTRLKRIFALSQSKAGRILQSPGMLAAVLTGALARIPVTGNSQSIFQKVAISVRILKAWKEGVYPGMARAKVGLLVAALVYFLMPADVVPDVVPLAGWADDAAVLTWVFSALNNEIHQFLTWEKSQKSSLSIS